MIIKEQILLENGGKTVKYKPRDYIFYQDHSAKYYFQVKSGTVKVNTFNDQGKEFFYDLPSIGCCIGEPYLFSGHKYPFNAIAISNCEVIQLEKRLFFNLIGKYPELLVNIYKFTAERNHFKNLILSTHIIPDPIDRLTILLDYIKEFHMPQGKIMAIPYTRQQLASLSGLCIETVIRAIKKMELHKGLSIINKKIWYPRP